MNKIIVTIFIILCLLFSGCSSYFQETIYKCENGDIVENLDECEELTCPPFNESKCPVKEVEKKVEVVKFKCANGEVVGNQESCNPPEPKEYFVCIDGTNVTNILDCEIPTSSGDFESPNIYIQDFYNDENKGWTLPYIVSNVVDEEEYEIEIFERLYDREGNNLWEESSSIGIYSGVCSHNNNCVPSYDSYLRYSISINPSQYKKGTYILEIEIIDKISGEKSIQREEITF